MIGADETGDERRIADLPLLRIAISGKSGCGNSTVSALLAQRLGYRVINYTFRNLASERGIAFESLRDLADCDPTWDRLVDEKQVALAREPGCVLGSRLAIWMVPDADLKVYLHASVAVRAQRIRGREGGVLADVLARTSDRDERDRQRYLRLYGIDNDNTAVADMVIDAESQDAESVVNSIFDRVVRRRSGEG